MKKLVLTLVGILFATLLIFGLIFRFINVPLLIRQPVETKIALFQGVTYERQVFTQPRDMVIHIVTVDLKAKGIKVLVTPGDPAEDLPLTAQTTSEFLENYNLQLAINGDAFYPWSVFGPFYQPHSGDAVNVYGSAASQGTEYSQDNFSLPTLYINQNNKASINSVVGRKYNAISGTVMLVKRGLVLPDSGGNIHPRTAVGLDRTGWRLIIVLVDGRQPGYSNGATLKELGQILVDNKAYVGFNLDGGGSSTLVIEGKDGKPKLLNSPIHIRISGNERPVGNHLGIYAKKNE